MKVVITKTKEQAEIERLKRIAVLKAGCPECGAGENYIATWDNLNGGIHAKCTKCGGEWDSYEE